MVEIRLKMSKQHQHELIKSPFPVVNEYEGEFVKDWNRNTAEAVATLLKYIARATASAIKQYSPEEVSLIAWQLVFFDCS